MLSSSGASAQKTVIDLYFYFSPNLKNLRQICGKEIKTVPSKLCTFPEGKNSTKISDGTHTIFRKLHLLEILSGCRVPTYHTCM